MNNIGSGDRSWHLIVAGLLAVAFVTNCSQPPLPENHYYRLGDAIPAVVHQTPPIEGPVQVKTMRADGLAGQRPIVYSERERPFEIRQYNYHYWYEAPPNMLQLQLIDYLSASGASGVVKLPDSGGAGGCTVTGHIRRFERLVGDNKPSTVLVEMDLRLERLDYSMTLFAGSYRAETRLIDEQMDDVVLAFNSAVTEIFDHFLKNLVDISATCG